MTVWIQLERLLREAGPERKAVGKAGGAPGAHFDKDIEGEDIDDIINSTKDERNSDALNLQQWNQKIEGYLNALRKVRKDAGEVVERFRNIERKTAQAQGQVKMTVDELREGEWEHGATWDNYLCYMFAQAGDKGIANGLRLKLKSQILQKRATPEKQSKLPGAPSMQSTFVNSADVERSTPEFQSFEEWAREQFPIMFPDQVLDEEAWDETMHWLASKGDQGPNWRFLYKLYHQGGPEGDRLFKGIKRQYEKARETKQQRRTDYEGQKAQTAQDSPQALALYNPQAIQMDKQATPHQDPEAVKKKFNQSPYDREERKFPTWWDFGFKGNIPFSDL